MFNLVPLRGDFTVLGRRTPDGCQVTVRTGNGRVHPLPLRLEWANSSPGGFEWGYLGSGPSQLALAILGLVCNQAEACRLHQRYKEDAIATISDSRWEIQRIAIDRWLEQHGVVAPRYRRPSPPVGERPGERAPDTVARTPQEAPHA